MNQRINTYLRQVVADLQRTGEMAPQEHPYSIYKDPGEIGDFRFCMLRKVLVPETNISHRDFRTINAKYAIRRLCGSPARWYGLENSSVTVEYVPLFAKVKPALHLERIPYESQKRAEAARARGLESQGAARKAVAERPFSPAALEQASETALETLRPQAANAAQDDDTDIFSADMDAEMAQLEQEAEKTLIGGETAQFRALVIDEEGGDEPAEEQHDELDAAVDQIMDELRG